MGRILVRILSCSLVAFATLEVCIRLDDYFSYGAPLWKPYTIDQIYEFDSLGRRGKPNAQFRKWKLNSLGYRGPELKPGLTRIVVFGASETFGLYEGPDHEFPRHLERQLNERAGKEQFGVVNAAYAGMPLSAMVPRVPEISRRLNPRVALIYPSPATYIWLPWLTPEKATVKRPVFDLRLKEQIGTVVKEVIPMPVQNWFRAREIARDVSMYGVLDRVPEENVRIFTRDLQRLGSELRSHGMEPVIVTHAHRFHDPPLPEDEDMLVAWRKAYPMLKETGFVDMEKRMNNAIRTLGASEHYTVIDAGPQIPPGPKYFADFTHFTDEGSVKMGQLLADGLYPVLKNCCAALHQLATAWTFSGPKGSTACCALRRIYHFSNGGTSRRARS